MGGRVLDERVYTDAAKHAVDFILRKVLSADGQLLHRFYDGEAAVAGNLDDYAFLIQGLLELYETTFDVDYLENALNLNEYLLKHFWDSKKMPVSFSQRTILNNSLSVKRMFMMVRFLPEIP